MLSTKLMEQLSSVYAEAVYGGTKEEKKDTRMTVTNADKKANTPAYQKMMAGDKRYKAADHMKEAVKGQDTEMRKAGAAERKMGDKKLSVKQGEQNADKMQRDIKFYDKLTKKEELEMTGKFTAEEIERILEIMAE